jgi:hypothetical protein
MELNQVDEILLDLGVQPVSNRFIHLDEEESVPYYPMRLLLEKQTGVIRLQTPFPVEEVKPRYDWLTCFEPEDHLDDMVKKIIDLPNINNNVIFAGYSFKDDSTLDRLKAKGYRNQWRIDPQRDLGITDSCANVETFQSMFNVAKAKQIQQRLGHADVMIVRHVVEHAYNLQEFVFAISSMIHDEGYIVWELPDCESALDKGDCTTVWEEHIHYFTSFTFKQMLENSGFNIIHYESVPYPLENSLVVITKKRKQVKSNILLNDNAVDVENNRAYQFAQKVNERKKVIQLKLRKFKKSNGSIAIFGAGHLSVAFISIMGIADLVDFVIDDNPHKKGMIMPIGNIEILGSDSLYSRKVNLCLLGLNPQNQPKVIANHIPYTENGGKFASIFPGTALDLEKII